MNPATAPAASNNNSSSNNNMSGQFGDTTYTKVFVGGLAWETQKDTMKKYFEQFGEILEAVVITDKASGRSKGYGFGGFGGAAAAAAFPSPSNFSHYAIQQGIPYNLYGYSSYSPDYTYPTGYYSVYGGLTGQFPMYGTGSSGLLSGAAAAFYPYLNFGEGNGGGSTGYTAASQGYGGVQYPHHLFPYSATVNTTAGYPAQHFANPISLAHTAPMQSGLTMAALRAPLPHR
nr:probable RNA-binding protein ARP1 isoform X2 [Ipomoea trifida]